MASNSVIVHTGQAWKFVVAIVAMLVGSFAPMWPETGIDWIAGTVLAVAGYAYGCLAIRCPGCGVRWFWAAAMRPEIYAPLAKASSCPDCKRDFGSAPTQEG